MSHHIYQTRAFVIDSRDTGEANKMLTLFTPDLGLITAAVQGVRVMKSKLRPSIQDLSFSKVSLVRGKEIWRLVSADKLISLYDRRIPLGVRRMMARTLAFLQRMSPGESRHDELFGMLSKLYSFSFEQKEFFGGMQQSTEESVERVSVTGLLAELRILDALGYGSDHPELKELSSASEWTQEVILQAVMQRELVERHIRQALESSHL